jgi:phytoene synthase
MRPPSSDTNPDARMDQRVCAALLRGGSRSFHAASLLLPSSVRGPATALYAFCREADDAVDLTTDRSGALDALRARLERIYAGHPDDRSADRALADVIARYAIPRSLPEALLEGFEWDAEGRRYRDEPQLEAYAARVAGGVGVMMALLMGERRPEVLARASDLGVAMQYTNIARDVGEDARAGRLYLPIDWLTEAGIDAEAWLAQPRFSPALGRVIARLLGTAGRLYRRAEPGIAALPAACQPGIRAARLLYAEIGHELERRGCDSVSQRTVVSGWRKLALLGASLAQVLDGGTALEEPALSQTRFLVDAVSQAGAAPTAMLKEEKGLAARIEDRVAWLIALFERLERNERAMAVAMRASAID